MNHGLESTELDAILKVADRLGGLMEAWGFKRTLGRLWTLLYLSPEPLSAADIAERLSMSAGSVSMTLNELMKWGAVKKAWVPGERREYYEVESSIWKSITRVLRERELVLVQDAAEVFQQIERLLNQRIDQTSDPQRRERLIFIVKQVGRLSLLAQVGRALLAAIINGESVDPSSVREVASASF